MPPIVLSRGSTKLAEMVSGLDVAEVAAAVEHYEGADMATRVMVDFLQELDRRLGERAPLELLASDSDTQTLAPPADPCW